MAGRGWVPGVAVRPVIGAAALLGLLAMHGLVAHSGAHCAQVGATVATTAGSVLHDGPAVTTGAMPSMPSMPSMASMASTTGVDGSSVVVPGGGAPAHEIAGLVGLCLTILVGVGALLLLAGAVRPVAVAAAVVPRLGMPRTARDRDPPSLLALSVQRC